MSVNVIIIKPEHLLEIETAAVNAFPEESCGLIIGHDDAENRLTITRVEVSPNRSEQNKHDSFEIDPQLRFDLMRELKDGPQRIIGHFHSHPNGPAQPSTRDANQTWEPALIWVITAVESGQAGETAAYAFDEKTNQFRTLKMALQKP